MPPSAAEIKAVVKALEGEFPPDATSKDVALAVIQALDVQREKSDKWITVVQIKLPETGWHHFALGPFSTQKQAAAAGQSSFPNTMKYKRDGDAKAMAVPVSNSEREAWESIRPENVNSQQWIKDMVKDWYPGIWAEKFTGKQGWGHKPAPVKDQVDKIEEHS